MVSEQPTEDPAGHDEPHPSTIDPDPAEDWSTDWPWDNEE